MTKIYHFDQNNSFGRFVINDELCPNVYIEAENAEEANEKALQVGIYFNGVEDGIDCPCCGDRWYPVSERDAVENMPKDEYYFGWCKYVIFLWKRYETS